MDRPDGAGGGTPTVVTSRATGDDLTSDDQVARPSGVMAPPRRPSPKPAAANSASADPAPPDEAVSGGMTGDGASPNGAPAAAKDSANGVPAHDTAGPAADVTAADAIPALPADTGGSSAAAAAAAETAAGPAKPSADPPSVSPAAFAWEMTDPPASSASSPPRDFLRSGPSTGNPAAKTGAADGSGLAATVADPAAAPEPGRKDSPQKPPAQKAPPAKKKGKRAARQAHLTIARLEPWSVMKFSFVVSLVAFVILFIAVSVLYAVLSAVGVFDSVQHLVTSLTSSQGSAGVNAKAWFTSSKVLGYTALLGSLNIVLITAMSTIGAVVYNLTSRLVGGVEVTLRESD
jgi:Transmembrane domain of unknown function (DUF3566)